MFVHFWLRQCRLVLRPHLYCLPSRFTLVRSLYWVLGLCSVGPGCYCIGAACADGSSAGSSASLAQCCRCGGFFPNSAIFRASFGDFCSCFGSLFSASLYPTVTSLVGFSCGPPSLVVPVCMCGVSFCGGGAVSSSSPPAGCGVDSC